ncbi:MAG: hypothetical protein HC884_03965 [Chloroflexaceae bacterium]|nr:hypothetical protein [Chloroflexaceae bacterium]
MCPSCGLLLVLLLFLLPFFRPSPVAAQDEGGSEAPPVRSEDWRERTTAHFIILYAAGYEATAEQYAGFVDRIYEEVATIFAHQTSTPITLRLYPTEESYAAVNPLAPDLPGIVAHADFRRREVAVILPVTAQQTPTEVQNNVRHELTHIVAADLSGNRLNTGFQEGIAQYVEEYTPVLERKVATLSRAREQGTLLAWDDFDDRDKVYGKADVSYPQTLSVVAFLIQQYDFAAFRDFLTLSAQSSGYRSALEQAYGKSPADLEAAWRRWLPAYLDEDYRHNALVSYDLSKARQLLDLGRYAEAQTELEQAIDWLQTEEPSSARSEQSAATLAEAQQLLERSKAGQQAENLAIEARTALQHAEYARASQLVALARAAYTTLGDTRQDAILAAYAERAGRGLRAQEYLVQADDMARNLKLPEARTASDAAAAEFAVLGDQVRMDQALSFRRSLDNRQQLIGTVLVALGIMGVLFSLWGRWFLREEEAW